MKNKQHKIVFGQVESRHGGVCRVHPHSPAEKEYDISYEQYCKDWIKQKQQVLNDIVNR